MQLCEEKIVGHTLVLSHFCCSPSGVTITESALLASTKLSTRYISGRHLPDKAIDCLDEAAAQVRLCGCVDRQVGMEAADITGDRGVERWGGVYAAQRVG